MAVKKLLFIAFLGAVGYFLLKVLIQWHSQVEESVNERDAGGQVEIVTCRKTITAYSPSRPSQVTGKFVTGTRLAILSKDKTTGMYLVLYTYPDGRQVRALCTARDLGK